MNSLNFLINNESQKFLTVKRWVASIVVCLLALILIAFSYSGEPTSDNWRDYLNERIVESQNYIAELSVDVEENREFILYEREMIELFKYRLDNNYPPMETFLQFVFDSFSLDTILILLVVITAVSIVSNEYSNNTILILLTSGEKRKNIILSKFLITIVYALGVLILYFLLSFVVGFCFFAKNGFGDTYLVIENFTIIHKDLVVEVFSGMLVMLIRVVTYATMAFFVSVMVKNNTISVITMLAILFLGGTIISVLNIDPRWSYLIVFSSVEILGDAITNYSDWSSGIFNKSIICCLFYSAMFVLGSFLCFSKWPLKKKHL